MSLQKSTCARRCRRCARTGCTTSTTCIAGANRCPLGQSPVTAATPTVCSGRGECKRDASSGQYECECDAGWATPVWCAGGDCEDSIQLATDLVFQYALPQELHSDKWGSSQDTAKNSNGNITNN